MAPASRLSLHVEEEDAVSQFIDYVTDHVDGKCFGLSPALEGSVDMLLEEPHILQVQGRNE